MEIGVFIPIGNNGWLISDNSPTYMPSFELNKQIVQKAESYGLDFALSMIKLRGFGGRTEHWDHNLESFTLMAGIAAVTSRIKLFASTAILTLPPALCARMAVTIDSIAPGRFGVNIVTGWQAAEYEQMSLWPGNAYFGYRYDYAEEYVKVMKDLWTNGSSDFKGKHFTMNDCKLSPKPSQPIKIVAAGQSPRGVEFAANFADYNFCGASGHNTPKTFEKGNQALVEAATKAGRDVGAMVLFMIIVYETDDEAWAKWDWYSKGVDLDATSWVTSQATKDSNAASTSTASRISRNDNPVNLNGGALIGSYKTVAKHLDEAAEIAGTKGIMLIFDDFLLGLDKFGKHVQPLMKSRSHVKMAA
ncbi:pyrimidine monooxygenase RutA [Coleophoma crateriformis]|uniref:Pyrimidine monooxygenase RutA n=1 Tax=Coleophoma crateriformis TaxID=565419 RepID=A0A3D8T8L5_9HELO|nr:pyrimidine monooxygenase RutA [Coleophoma crateriformis]